MASIEFINKRIEGKRKEIEKLEKKLDRIRKAEATNWEVNPYYYSESDLKWTLKDLDSAKEALSGYEKDLSTATDKAQSRNVPAITEFLDNWYNRMMQMYTEAVPKYLEAKKAYYKADSEYCDWFNHGGWRASKEERKAKDQEHRNLRKQFNEKWGWIAQYMYIDTLETEKLERDLKNEYNRKYDFIIERTNEIVKVITDASGLYIGSKGDLNGYIIGTNGTAKVQTIGAGGYNIQCFHFRTLINRA